jgi:micrococcal nuclease
VAFVTDPSQGMYDRYGRTLAWIRPTDGTTRSKRPARVRPIPTSITAIPRPRASEIAAAEQEAKAAGRGLWGPPCYGQTASVPE